jgi:plastocyanin
MLMEPPLRAADTTVKMVEGSQNDPNTWRFAPEQVTVPVGTKIVWRNEGKIEHTATAKGLFDSGNVGPGGTFEFQFTTPGDINYVCKPHEALGMTGVIHVTGGAPTTVATTTATQPAPSGGATTTTATTASTSTTAKNGAAANSTTTTTAGTGVTATTQAPSVTPTSGPDAASETTTTTAAAQAGGEEAAGGHNAEGGSHNKKEKNSPIGIAFASVSTLLLAAIAGKLLASKP